MDNQLKCKTINFLGKNIGENFGIRGQQRVFGLDTKSMIHKRKNWSSSKLKTFAMQKNLISSKDFQKIK